MLLKILAHPDERLRKKSKSVEIDKITSPKIQRLISDMAETMLKKDGLGLAAPQVNKLWRLIIVNTKDGPQALINPKIVRKSWRKEIDEEGCLSIPNTYAKVKRSAKIKARAYNQAAKEINFNANGLFARVIQHEVDHLDGILFIDKTL